MGDGNNRSCRISNTYCADQIRIRAAARCNSAGIQTVTRRNSAVAQTFGKGDSQLTYRLVQQSAIVEGRLGSAITPRYQLHGWRNEAETAPKDLKLAISSNTVEIAGPDGHKPPGFGGDHPRRNPVPVDRIEGGGTSGFSLASRQWASQATGIRLKGGGTKRRCAADQKVATTNLSQRHTAIGICVEALTENLEAIVYGWIAPPNDQPLTIESIVSHIDIEAFKPIIDAVRTKTYSLSADTGTKTGRLTEADIHFFEAVGFIAKPRNQILIAIRIVGHGWPIGITTGIRAGICLTNLRNAMIITIVRANVRQKVSLNPIGSQDLPIDLKLAVFDTASVIVSRPDHKPLIIDAVIRNSGCHCIIIGPNVPCSAGIESRSTDKKIVRTDLTDEAAVWMGVK